MSEPNVVAEPGVEPPPVEVSASNARTARVLAQLESAGISLHAHVEIATTTDGKYAAIVPLRERTAQAFFAGLADETRAPHYGDHARDFVRILLQRAEKAGLFTPEQP